MLMEIAPVRAVDAAEAILVRALIAAKVEVIRWLTWVSQLGRDGVWNYVVCSNYSLSILTHKKVFLLEHHLDRIILLKKLCSSLTFPSEI